MLYDLLDLVQRRLMGAIYVSVIAGRLLVRPIEQPLVAIRLPVEPYL